MFGQGLFDWAFDAIWDQTMGQVFGGVPQTARAIVVVLMVIVGSLLIGGLVGWFSPRSKGPVTVVSFLALALLAGPSVKKGIEDAMNGFHGLRNTTQAYAFGGSSTGAGACSETDLVLATIKARESDTGGGYVAVSPDGKAFGAYQFQDATWAEWGGVGHASDAPPAEQDQRARAYVEWIIATYGGHEAVPVQWFYPAALADASLLDFAPNPLANGGQTVREYQSRWLATYGELAASCSSMLVPIGQGSHQLTTDAAAAFTAWQQAYGAVIPITDSYRSWDLQAQRHAEEPGRFVSPEHSAHVSGEAVDVNMFEVDEARLIAAATATGWCQAALNNDEPWHFSFNGCR